MKIGAHVATTLIEDRSTLQMALVDRCGNASLHNHKDRCTHRTKPDGIIDLMNLRQIPLQPYPHPNKSVTPLLPHAAGLRLYQRQPGFQLDIDYVNDLHIIRRNDKMMAINSAINRYRPFVPIPLASTSIPVWSGQMDFMRALRVSEW